MSRRVRLQPRKLRIVSFGFKFYYIINILWNFFKMQDYSVFFTVLGEFHRFTSVESDSFFHLGTHRESDVGRFGSHDVDIKFVAIAG